MEYYPNRGGAAAQQQQPQQTMGYYTAQPPQQQPHQQQVYYQQQPQAQHSQAQYQHYMPAASSAQHGSAGQSSMVASSPGGGGARGGGGGGGRGGRGGGGDSPAQQQGVHMMGAPYMAARLPPAQEIPLRMVVDAKLVGAIIGQGGANIKEITKESKARCVVDVQRGVRDANGHIEKVITILGVPENCSRACVKILEVIVRENEKENPEHKCEVELKLRAHNQLVGRLIGKGGSTIKKIMQETNTTIFVSNDGAGGRGDMAAMPFDLSMVERTITVRGTTIDDVSNAEHAISAKLKQSFETDLNNRMPMAPNGMPMMPAAAMMDPFAAAMAAMRTGQQGGPQGAPFGGGANKVTKMWVPNSLVGAIIGSKGSHIRTIMRNSGAHIRIDGGQGQQQQQQQRRSERGEAGEGRSEEEDEKEEHTEVEKEEQKQDEEEKKKDEEEEGESSGAAAAADDGEHSPQQQQQRRGAGGQGGERGERGEPEEQRLVTITGNEVQQYKAQFWIYQRIAEQTQHYIDDVKLRTEVTVPSRLVGRIIGKGGQNVRELQRVTGAMVKIPDESGASASPAAAASEEDKKDEPVEPATEKTDETVVRIVGTFQASQSVQYRIGQLIAEFARTSLHGGGGERGGHGQHSPSRGAGGGGEGAAGAQHSDGGDAAPAADSQQ